MISTEHAIPRCRVLRITSLSRQLISPYVEHIAMGFSPCLPNRLRKDPVALIALPGPVRKSRAFVANPIG